MKARILLVESDRALIDKILSSLLAEDFAVEVALDAESGYTKAAGRGFDLIILDAALCADRTGFAVCDELRRKGFDTSILMLTAKGRSSERVTGLRLGADDCVPRSCDTNELLARVEALLRRVPKSRRQPISSLRFDDVEIDFETMEARKFGHPLSMAAKELRLLRYLADNRDRVVSRKEILKHVWDYDSAVSSRTVDVHIGWLRQKLEADPQNPKYIKTIRGRGYRFDSDEPLGRCGSRATSLSQ